MLDLPAIPPIFLKLHLSAQKKFLRTIFEPKYLKTPNFPQKLEIL